MNITKTEKIIARIVSIILSFMVCSVCSASADTTKTNGSANAVYRISGSSVSQSFIREMDSLGISICEDTIVEIVPAISEVNINAKQRQVTTNATALVVTNNITDSTMSKDLVLMVDDNNRVDYEGYLSTMGYGSADFPPKSWDGRFVVTGRALYDNPKGEYYRPTEVRFSYKKYETCTVDAITVMYICDGFEYTYPEYSPLGDDDIEWVISKYAKSPSVGTTYSNKNHKYPSSKVIYTGSGSPSVGNLLTFVVNVDGKKSQYTVKL